MNEWVVLPTYLIAGAVAGLLSGLLGIGGGLVMVPALLLCFSVLDIPPNVVPALALGTSLATIAITAFLSARAHYKIGNLVDPFSWRMRLLAVSLAIGVVIGARITTNLSREHLYSAIGIFQFIVAAWMWRRSMLPFADRAGDAENLAEPPQNMLPRLSARWFFGLVGIVSSISGIGGATLMVPYFDRFSIPFARAAALSTYFGCVIGVLGFVSYGLIESPPQPIAWSLGYVNLPAVAAMAGGSYYLTKIGAKLSKKIPGKTLTKGFSLLLFGSSAKLLLSLLSHG